MSNLLKLETRIINIDNVTHIEAYGKSYIFHFKNDNSIVIKKDYSEIDDIEYNIVNNWIKTIPSHKSNSENDIKN